MGWEFKKGLVGAASPHMVEIRQGLELGQQGEGEARAGWVSLTLPLHVVSGPLYVVIPSGLVELPHSMASSGHSFHGSSGLQDKCSSKQVEKGISFSDLALKVTLPHFCCIL